MRRARSVFHLTALAAVGAIVAACGAATTAGISVTPNGAFGKVPPETGTAHAGTITVAFAPGDTPNWILPVVPGENSTVYDEGQFLNESWRGLSAFPDGAAEKNNPATSLADAPVWSNGDKTVSMTLKPWKWSDGTEITAKDAAFWIDLVKAAVAENPANWGGYIPGQGIYQVTSMTAVGQTLTLHLNAAVNPTEFWVDNLAGIVPLPAQAWAKASASGPILDFTVPANATAIYNYLAAQSKDLSTYATNPLWQVVDGPYKISAYNNTTGAFTMVPNTAYSGPHATPESNFEGVPFTSETAEWNAVKAGSIDIGFVPFQDLPQVKSVEKNYNVFGYPGFGFTVVLYNFKDTTGDFNNIIKQLYVRQALAHLEDEQGQIKAFFYGAGGQDYGPVPVVPPSPYTPANATKDPYPFSVPDAISILKAHGWTVTPGGTDTCSKPGTGASECGAGIPAGTKLAWNLIYSTAPAVFGEQVEDLASQAKKAGIEIKLTGDTLNHMVSTYFDSANPAGIDLWASEYFGGFAIGSYPTTNGIFSTNGPLNLGDYSNSHADALIHASVTGTNPDAVRNEASYLTIEQPGLFMPSVDDIVAWKATISGPPTAFELLTQLSINPEFMYFTK